MATWRVIEVDGGYTVQQGRGRRTESASDLNEALRYIKGRFQPGDKVLLMEPDGYQTVITRQVAGTRWRR